MDLHGLTLSLTHAVPLETPKIPVLDCQVLRPQRQEAQPQHSMQKQEESSKAADVFEEAANRKRTAAQARPVIAALHVEITGEGLPVQTLRQFFHQWNES